MRRDMKEVPQAAAKGESIGTGQRKRIGPALGPYKIKRGTGDVFPTEHQVRAKL